MPLRKGQGVMYIAGRDAPNPHQRTATDISRSDEEKSLRRRISSVMGPRSTTSLPWALLYLLPFLSILAYVCKEIHYDLPKPVVNGNTPNGPVFSETNALSHVKALEDIGYRTVGTDEAVLGEEYVYNTMRELLRKCEGSENLECTLWMQEGDGKHQFDIMQHAVLKSYNGIRNVIFRVAGINTTTTIEGERMKNSVLLNSHIDSTLPSKGAADDAIGVGVMIELARILVERDAPIVGGAIFLFNGAEESLQDGSHMYSTQHETRHDVKTVINLEAAGTTGQALLFQATSEEMIDIYGKVARPHGNVIALEIFESGVIMSDTDFVQFVKYLDVPGLDMAIVGHSYYYHTSRDSVENIQAGSAQHFGDTVLTILDNLLVAGSPLNIDTPWSPPKSIYFSLYDRIYVKYSQQTASIYALSLTVAFAALFLARVDVRDREFYMRCWLSPAAGFGTGLVTAVAIGAFLRYGLGKGQSWFTHEQLPLVIFGFPALSAILAREYFANRDTTHAERLHLERASAFAAVFHPILLLDILQVGLGIRSAYLFSNVAATGLISLVLSEITAGRRAKNGYVPFWAIHGLWSAISVIFAVEGSTAFLDTFVPLTGRMGSDAPGDIIIAVLSAFLTHQFMPTLVPFFHRFNLQQQKRLIATLLLGSAALIAYFGSPLMPAYDVTHPKRIGVQYLYNTTSSQTTLHVGQLDGGPGYEEFVEKLHERYGLATVPVTKNDRHTSDWDVIYPISAFIESDRFPIIGDDITADTHIPQIDIKIIHDRFDKASGYRTVDLYVSHTGLVGPVLSFNAEVMAWSFREAPAVGDKRHYIKAASAPGHEGYEVTMTVKPETPDHKLDIHWVGIDRRQMYPGTSERLGPNLPANKMFKKMDAWIKEEWKGSMEPLLVGSISGSIII